MTLAREICSNISVYKSHKRLYNPKNSNFVCILSKRFSGGDVQTGGGGTIMTTHGQNVTMKLAEAYRICWAVESAVQIAYE